MKLKKGLIIVLCVVLCTIVLTTSLLLNPVSGIKPTLKPTLTPKPPTPMPTTPTPTPKPPVTQVLSIPAAAFNYNGYQIQVRYPSQSVTYWAPLQLPQGAKITQISFCFADAAPSSVAELSLWHGRLGGGESIASVYSLAHTSGYNSVAVPSTATGNPVNNNAGTYMLQLFLRPITSPGDFTFYYATVKYQV